MNLSIWYANNKTTLLLFISTAAIFWFVYFYYPARPGINFFTGLHDTIQPGWISWADQGIYYQMSTAIANGTFDATKYLYPIGYPILSVPFAYLGHDHENSILSYHRFFIPNLLMLFVVVYIVFNLIKRLTGNITAAILGLISLFFLTLYLPWFIEPWTLHVLDVGFIVIFYIFFRKQEEISSTHLIIAGLIFGWIFASRPVDVIWLAPIFAGFLVFRPKKIVYFVPGMSVVMLVFLSYFIFFGGHQILPNLYQDALGDSDKKFYEKFGFTKFDFHPMVLMSRAYCVLIEPLHCVPEKTGDKQVDDQWYYGLFDKTPFLASSSVFLIFSPLGTYVLFRKTTGFPRLIFALLILGFTTSVIFYLALWGFYSGWTRFWRYEMFWLPLSTVFSIYGINLLYSKVISKSYKAYSKYLIIALSVLMITIPFLIQYSKL